MRVIPEINHIYRKRSVSLSGVMSVTHGESSDALAEIEGKKVIHFDSKDLILQFNNLNVTPRTLSLTTLHPESHHASSSLNANSLDASIAKSSSNAATKTSPTKAIVKQWRFKSKNRHAKIILRPSRLKLGTKDSDTVFRDFSADCAKELDSIVKLAPSKLSSGPQTIQQMTEALKLSSKKKGQLRDNPASVSAPSQNQKRRKASSCAEQARQVGPQDDLSEAVNILADFLEESVVFPKKMSYMAELMYT